MCVSPRSNATQAPRKSHATPSTPQKYCSDRCRREKPRPGPSTEADIEMAFVRLLGDGRERGMVKCEDVERAVFSMSRRYTEEEDERIGSLDADGQREDEQSDDGEEAEDEDGGVRLSCHMDHRPAATTTMKPELEKGRQRTPRGWGMQKAKEREMVRRAARRGVAFGFEIEEGRRRRRVEAVQGGRVVESSLAKGEWGVRWRE